MIKEKIKNLFILIFCYLYSLIWGKATKKIKTLNKILVIQTAKLGDLVCTTPVFRAIKLNYPQAKVYVLGNVINQELLNNNSDIDNYLIKTNSLSPLIKIIKKENFDIACIVTPSFFNLAAVFLAGVPLVVAPRIIGGYCPFETKAYKILSKLVITKQYNFNGYFPREYLKLLEPINIYSEDTTKHLNYSKHADSAILEFFNKNQLSTNDLLVGLAPSVANKIKQWPVQNFASLTDYLFNKYNTRIILIGSNDDRAIINEFVKLLNPQTKFYEAIGFNLDQLKALIAKLSIFISVDTGPIYIAEAFNIPTIDIVGPMAANEQPPQGKYHKIVQINNRIPQLHIMNARVYDEKEARRQIEEITLQMVIEKFEELMSIL